MCTCCVAAGITFEPGFPLPKIEWDKLYPLDEVIRRFKLREKYGMKVEPSFEKGDKDFPDVLTQTVCDIKKDT